jgi:hypothetical protein
MRTTTTIIKKNMHRLSIRFKSNYGDNPSLPPSSYGKLKIPSDLDKELFVKLESNINSKDLEQDLKITHNEHNDNCDMNSPGDLDLRKCLEKELVVKLDIAQNMAQKDFEQYLNDLRFITPNGIIEMKKKTDQLILKENKGIGIFLVISPYIVFPSTLLFLSIYEQTMYSNAYLCIYSTIAVHLLTGYGGWFLSKNNIKRYINIQNSILKIKD